jgi:hypothetical protein
MVTPIFVTPFWALAPATLVITGSSVGASHASLDATIAAVCVPVFLVLTTWCSMLTTSVSARLESTMHLQKTANHPALLEHILIIQLRLVMHAVLIAMIAKMRILATRAHYP